ncbi:SDR family oxidoreductase [Kineococcus arenarius]|uniref:SDR family oxidoreductase n=1 Tax=unclassified Kineococcus TaxID=2621656 RepID=UPI003D7E0746
MVAGQTPSAGCDERRQVVLITGASSGIGAATALHLAQRGHRVVVGARRTDRLAELVGQIRVAGGAAEAHAVDVTDAASVADFVTAARTRYGRVDVFVANAGVMPLSPLAAGDLAGWNQMIDVNVRGLLHGLAAVLPVFSDQRRGHVVTIASIGAHEVSPTAAVYCATKFAAWAISEGLRQEATDGLKVTTVSPGVVDSELAGTITDPAAAEAMRAYRSVAISPEAVAAAVAYAITQPDDVDVSEVVVRPSSRARS